MNKSKKEDFNAIINGNIFEDKAWIHYWKTRQKINNCGKWMIFFNANNYEFVKEICIKAINEKIINSCKHTAFEIDSLIHEKSEKYNSGVICFYLDGTLDTEHKKVLKFLKNNDLIRKTKTGKLYNISFKFDDQTRMGEYGNKFNPIIKLSDFINLETYEFI